MTTVAFHGAPARAPSVSGVSVLRVHRSKSATSQFRTIRRLTVPATGGFQDSAGPASSTDAADVTDVAASPTTGSHLIPVFASLFSQLRQHTSSMAQHLEGVQNLAFAFSSVRNASFIGPGRTLSTVASDSSHAAAHAGSNPAMRALPVQIENPMSLHASGHEQHFNEVHAWLPAPGGLRLPWSQQSSAAQSPATRAAGGSLSAPGPSGAATDGEQPYTKDPGAAAAVAEPTPPLVILLLLGPSGIQAAIGARLAVVALLCHSAVALPGRAAAAALSHLGHAVETAERAARSLPPPREVPQLVHYGAVIAAARAEESVVLALAHTATAASAAAAGVPAATAAVTGSAAAAAAAAAVSAPHLPLLRHSRRRLLAAAVPALERLRELQRGCTTHVLLRFLLFSSLNPGLRRDLLVQLDVLARRATQLALLQEQHDAWMVRQTTNAVYGADATAALRAAARPNSPARHPYPGTAGGEAPAVTGIGSAMAGAGACAPGMSARWFRNVFAPEMQACARQLRCEAPPETSAPGVAGGAGVSDPPGRFDLRDLYRLMRVIEVAVEDLERYQ